MVKEKVFSGLICLLAMGVLVDTGFGVSKEPAKDQTKVQTGAKSPVSGQKGTQKSVKQLAAEIQSTKDNSQKNRLLEKLSSIGPQTATDVEDLISIAKSTQDKVLRVVVLGALDNIKEEDKHLEKVFIKALDDRDRDVRIAMIMNLRKIKSKEALPKLREIVKDFSGTKYKLYKLKKKAMGIFKSPLEEWETLEETFKMLQEPGMAAIALGEMKDEEAIPILVEKFYDLEGFGSEALAKMGKKALPQILELAKKEIEEKDYKKYYAKWALASIEDKEAKMDLINIVKARKERDVRDSALTSLVRFMYDDEVLEMVKNLYEKEKDTLFLHAMQNKKALPFLIDVLKNDSSPDARECAVVIIDKIGDPSAVPALEEALKDRDKEVRYCASQALITIADRESLIRLKDYLNNNLGKVESLEYDKYAIRLIDNRLKSGKQGVISFDEKEKAKEEAR
ncbi:HEAT repeat domain-containing protein [bacterium]|nr:HEAT repeat domain-containing protein [bacterium]